MSERYVLSLDDIDGAQVAVAGGKGAGLGELSRVDGVDVPAGFVVTTDAFQLVMAAVPGIGELLGRLSGLDPADSESIRVASGQVRQAIEETEVPGGLASAIRAAVARAGEGNAYAVRSSATAEDLPTASFAGQQDSYLNVTGPDAVVRHVSRCWASLFTERAVAYRLRNGFGHRAVQMAVVVQRMVNARAAGVLFTADPVTGNRKVVSVEAVRGLGEALVSGRVNPDVYSVRDDTITSKAIAAGQPALTDEQVVRLARLGRRIEAHFGRPQDIEWCLADGSDGTGDEFRVVQSRPITTLFPVPQVSDDDNHVYLSVGHQQMMTDPMKPLGISLWQLTAARPMTTAGGRLFVDITRDLAVPATRARIVTAAGTSDPLTGDALAAVLDREGFIPELPDAQPAQSPAAARAGSDTAGKPAPTMIAGNAKAGAPPAPLATDPAIVTGLVELGQSSVDALKRDIRAKSGTELLDFIIADIAELKRTLFGPDSAQVIRAGMQASAWLNQHLAEWLGEKNAADTLAQSAPGNVTAEMGLALLDVADVIRPHPDVVAFLESVKDNASQDELRPDEFDLGELASLDGGPGARDAIGAFLDRYGMRCAGEIDITRPRWAEHPATLVPAILGNVRNFGPGAGKQRFEQGLAEASAKERELLARLRALPAGEDGTGEEKAAETKRMIDRLRTFTGYREYPKYHMVSRYFAYKQALLADADRLVRAGVLRQRDDLFFLTFDELRAVMRTNQADGELIRQRADAFESFKALTPPRVLTSDGEAVTGTYRRDGLPAGALIGLPVSAGTVEGRARVLLDMADADLGADDILVTPYTDPSWTPAFVAIKGLVTEVGGLMTHGAVIAREYGLPAVVGVEHATRLIRDGQRIRVHGTDGYVEILS